MADNFIAVVFLSVLSLVAGAEVNTDFQGMMFLYRYGYISDHSMSEISDMSSPVFDETMKKAVLQYQEFYGLNITGKMNHETEQLMSEPRCGLEDLAPFEEEDRTPRKKRYVLQGNRWRTTSLKYRINSLPSRAVLSRTTVAAEMDKVFRTWNSVSNLEFRNSSPTDRDVDLEIEFVRGRHGDGNNFDGPSGTLAHAFYPNQGLGGDVHFDDEESWTSNGGRGTDFFSVALHEVGHALGLAHSPIRESIMYASYFGPKPRLHEDDIQGIQALYGEGRATPIPPRVGPGPRAAGAPELCRISSVDAVLTAPQGVYVFKGEFCYRLMPNLRSVVPGYPQMITNEFKGMEKVEQLDAALAWPGGEIFLFSGERVWTFRQGSLFGSVQNVRERFPGIPGDIQAAFLWPRDRRTYFFRADQYWRYDNTTVYPVKSMFPRSVTRWTGVSGPVDGVLNLNSSTYFFQRNVYYRYNDLQYNVPRGYPRNTADNLYGCSASGGQAQGDDRGLVNIPVKQDCPDEDDTSGVLGRRKGAGEMVNAGTSVSVTTVTVILIFAWMVLM